MLKILVLALLALAVAVGAAGAKTATQTRTTTTTQSASNADQGVYDKLSPGNQKIVDALYNAQPTPSAAQSSGSTTGSGTGSTTTTSTNFLSKDDIAAMHQDGKGWGVIFKDMKANDQLPPDVRNLGHLVSGRYHPQATTSGSTTITSASGKSQVVAKPDVAGRSGKGHFDDEGSSGAQGSTYRDNSGRGSFSGGPDRGNGYGQGGSGAGAGGRGVGRGK